MSDIASIFGRNEFLIRRLHSLTGLVPVGAFLVVHLLTNAAILDGSYQQRVDQIHSLGPLTLQFVEWCFIFLPILFHGIIGMIIVARGKRNVLYYSYRENFRYTLQRWTGVVAFAFILWHVFHTRGWINSEWWLEHFTKPLGGGQFDADHAIRTGTGLLRAAPWIGVLYGFGLLASVYHLANGVWTMGITWGVWTSSRAQNWASLACGAFGLWLFTLGMWALIGFYVVKV